MAVDCDGAATDEEDLDEKYGPICTVCDIPCFNIGICGCTKCTVQDKQMMVALFILIALIVVATIGTQLAEAKAISMAGSAVMQAASATVSMLVMWKSIFSFLSNGVMAMIGVTRTQSNDEDDQADADHKTGKVLQVALLAAVVAGGICVGLSFAVYEPYLRIWAVDDAEIEMLRPYLNMVAPTLILHFPNQVSCRSDEQALFVI